MAISSRLRYLGADHVEAPLCEFAAADVLDDSGRKLGSVDGLLVDPAKRKAIYLVIRRTGLLRARRKLLPIADIQIEGRALRVHSKPALEEFDRRRYPAFSDDDLLTTMFADRAA